MQSRKVRCDHRWTGETQVETCHVNGRWRRGLNGPREANQSFLSVTVSSPRHRERLKVKSTLCWFCGAWDPPGLVSLTIWRHVETRGAVEGESSPNSLFPLLTHLWLPETTVSSGLGVFFIKTSTADRPHPHPPAETLQAGSQSRVVVWFFTVLLHFPGCQVPQQRPHRFCQSNLNLAFWAVLWGQRSAAVTLTAQFELCSLPPAVTQQWHGGDSALKSTAREAESHFSSHYKENQRLNDENKFIIKLIILYSKCDWLGPTIKYKKTKQKRPCYCYDSYHKIL